MLASCGVEDSEKHERRPAMTNSKARSAAIFHAALSLTDADPTAAPGTLARCLAAECDCHLTTAWRHIKRALAAKAGQSDAISSWGGMRPGAGRIASQKARQKTRQARHYYASDEGVVVRFLTAAERDDFVAGINWRGALSATDPQVIAAKRAGAWKEQG